MSIENFSFSESPESEIEQNINPSEDVDANLNFPNPEKAEESKPQAEIIPRPMSREEFNKRYWFHGKGKTHPTFGHEDVTGGVTSDFEEAAGYARQGGEGEIHIIDKRKLPAKIRQQFSEWIRDTRVSPKRKEEIRIAAEKSGLKIVGDQRMQVGDLDGENITSDFIVPYGTKDPYQYLVDKGFISQP